VIGRYRRPLLALDRATTARAAAAEGFDAWLDPHNLDPAYARVRVRTDALPALEQSIGPGVAAALARTADLLRADADALDGWAQQAYSAASGAAGLEVAALAGLPAAVRRRVLRLAAVAAGCPAGSLAAVHVDALDGLVVGWHGQGVIDLPGGVGAQRACDTLSFLPRPWLRGAQRTPERREPRG
jgi:tRNA(Ile)-lysidine synthase